MLGITIRGELEEVKDLLKGLKLSGANVTFQSVHHRVLDSRAERLNLLKQICHSLMGQTMNITLLYRRARKQGYGGVYKTLQRDVQFLTESAFLKKETTIGGRHGSFSLIIMPTNLTEDGKAQDI